VRSRLQICRNFELLKEVGKTRKPVLLKRGMPTPSRISAVGRICYSEGNHNCICASGGYALLRMRAFYLDISAVPVIKKKLSHLPS